MNYKSILRLNLIKHEGLKHKPYLDPAGKLTIGVGHNLDDNGLTPAAIDFILGEDVEVAEAGALTLYPNFHEMSDNRKAAVVELVFNMGLPVMQTFKRANAAINSQSWEVAAQELEGSRWYRQVGKRGDDVVKLIRGG